MTNPIDLIQAYRQRMTGEIPRQLAQLYSAHIRLAWESESFPKTIRQDRELLRDAIKLVETGFFEKEHGVEPVHWQASLRRAGEILEWLSHPQMELPDIPTRLLAAAAYQLAGYPARAAGILRSADETDSPILRAFLQADFPTLFDVLTQHWAEFSTDRFEYGAMDTNDPDAFSHWLSDLVVFSTLSAIGVIAAQMRWGDENRVEKALAKLETTSKLLLHCDDFYSWLLGELCAQIGTTYNVTALRQSLQVFAVSMSGKAVLERYLRQAYRQNKTLAWPSQLCGIERLCQQKSFALCTPTGSGKTTVAELAILQGLFSNTAESAVSPLVLYLVPSRALATEVEFKLSEAFKILRTEETPEIIVTGLYGGADWGPTDAWLLRNDPTILICTYEKAEALMRYLGVTLTERLSLVILDEAHKVQFDGNEKRLAEADNRSLRLETLAMRLFSTVERHNGQVIALSAVAQDIETALASWIANTPDAEPAKADYHSTRRLLGQLECKDRGFRIRYDLLDHKRLRLSDSRKDNAPFIPQPFSPYPSAPLEWEPARQGPVVKQDAFWGQPKVIEPEKPKTKPSKYLYPYLFWAAIQLAKHQTVLIAVPQHPEWYAEGLLIVLDSWQKTEDCPQFFRPPEDDGEKLLWQNCLASCEDYLGQQSREYRLLEKGVVVHHGKMPAPLARLLVGLIDKRIARLVIATSTLSEGINLPFETILLPDLRRYDESVGELQPMQPSDIANLMGRAGRPGFTTEGQALVLTMGSKNIAAYIALSATLEAKPEVKPNPQSALHKLLTLLYKQWQLLSHSNDLAEFLTWLEQVTPSELSFQHLDTLDDILLTAIVELESQSGDQINPDDLEDRLKAVWHRSYACFAIPQEARWEQIFIQRGRAIVTHEARNYGDRKQRRRLYTTTLPPRAAGQLLDLYPSIEMILQSGGDYAIWDSTQRFQYIVNVAIQINQIAKFTFAAPSKKFFKQTRWENILHWWLDPFWGYDDEGMLISGFVSPVSDQAFKWYQYVNANFIYKLNWGIGSCISIAFSHVYDGERRIPNVENWPDSGLPWIVFWLKELITWGTLEPVAAYLLARARSGGIITRPEAERRAQEYYQSCSGNVDEWLNPQSILKWTRENVTDRVTATRQKRSRFITVNLLRDFSTASQPEFRVLPAEKDGKILWFDAAGFLLAESERPAGWNADWIRDRDFRLDYTRKQVQIEPYL
ncbi:MAG: DEAD/DEAH box helicase [Chloroflexota bacterium]|nr:DEAD/DEAH box helicase [Chloroflexota bacterium]